MKKSIFKGFEYEIIINGASFCHVKINKELFQDKPSIILGNQKWKGAAPNFNIIVELIIKFS